MTHWRRFICLQCSGLIIALLAFATPLYATTQCPAEFGPKNPLIDLFGWLVVVLCVLVGGLFAAFIYRYSRKMRLLVRVAAAILGLIGMLAIWGGSLVLAIGLFFLRC